MKLFLIIFSLTFVTFKAFSEVKRFGEFVPSECSVRKVNSDIEISIVAVKDVCWGELAQMNQLAVSIETNDGSTLVYKVKITAKDARVGATTTKFIGQLSREHSKNNRLTRDRIEGKIISVVSPRAKPSIEFRTDSNLKGQFDLERVFTTQSL